MLADAQKRAQKRTADSDFVQPMLAAVSAASATLSNFRPNFRRNLPGRCGCRIWNQAASVLAIFRVFESVVS